MLFPGDLGRGIERIEFWVSGSMKCENGRFGQMIRAKDEEKDCGAGNNV